MIIVQTQGSCSSTILKIPLEKGIFSQVVLSCQHFGTAWVYARKFHLYNRLCNPLSQLPVHAKVSDPAEDYILSLHQHFLIHPTACVSRFRIMGIFAKTTLAASVPNTLFELCSDVIKRWQNLLQGVHACDGPPYNTLVKVIQ